MSDDWDPKNKICRDDDCDIDEVHLAHKRLRRRSIIVHRRPKRHQPLARTALPQEPDALSDSILKAVGDYPMMMHWIQRDVRDDYGSVSDRSVYRYVRRLVEQARMIKLDVGLAFAIYIKPRARLLADPSAIRDYMLANADCLPACTKLQAG